MNRSADYEVFDFDYLIRETEGAYYVSMGDYDEPVWIPKSVSRDLDEDSGTVEVQEWWLVEKGVV